ncbi:site-specific integrase [Sedimentibacter hydroxybenzoicus DSM 7310]|uniref:Site-specific integrase n=1 Tax=Sedimentibacter hydroxybenzoicus DSM 7310 TaxID=1123245 RepID=A0A974GVY2_SEDHY|nr:site-specific integrase [Sedimentibacter hydroxybenzoicus]NYB73897.1 site-specific integrase [Sedimentibacter hydroxybenzoicus DSM 7310]
MKNGKFQATVYIGRDSDGKQLRKYITADTERECKAKARKLETEIDEGVFVNIENKKVGKYLDEWLELQKNSIAPSTYLLYKGYIRAHYKPAFGDIKMSKLNELHIQKFKNDKLQELAVNTVRKLLFVLRKALQDGMKNKNPARDIEVPQKEKTRFRLLTDDEFNIIHKEAKKNIFDECIILLAAWGGLRRGEIFALKPNDLYLKDNFIRVDEARSISENGYIDKDPKSENGFRDVVIPKYLSDLLSRYIKQKGEIPDRLFDVRPDHYTHRFATLKDRTSLKGEDMVFQDLRHYQASWLYKNGMPDQYSAERLGHDIITMKKIYQHLDKSIKIENDKKVIEMFK